MGRVVTPRTILVPGKILLGGLLAAALVSGLAAGNLELTAKVTNESRAYVLPKDRPSTWNEVFFDNLFVQWRVSRRLPLTVTAGRQDMSFGAGFVVADGFNWVRFELQLKY
jgi:hypothetical protein